MQSPKSLKQLRGFLGMINHYRDMWHPLDIENTKEKWDEDNNDLQQASTKHPEWYSHKTFDQVTGMLCYTKPGGNPSN